MLAQEPGFPPDPRAPPIAPCFPPPETPHWSPTFGPLFGVARGRREGGGGGSLPDGSRPNQSIVSISRVNPPGGRRHGHCFVEPGLSLLLQSRPLRDNSPSRPRLRGGKGERRPRKAGPPRAFSPHLGAPSHRRRVREEAAKAETWCQVQTTSCAVWGPRRPRHPATDGAEPPRAFARAFGIRAPRAPRAPPQPQA